MPSTMSGGVENMHLENVCRLCLTDASEAGDMLPIFPVRGGNPNNPTSVVNRILQCTSLKLEQADGVPATICELCSVRLEDWHAFREQCIGSDEYLRVTLRHAFYPEEGIISPASTSSTVAAPPPVVADPTQTITARQQLASTGTELISTARQIASKTPPPMPSSVASSHTSLAKRRQSTFEWPVSDGKGNATGQNVIVEVLGVCPTPEKPKNVVPPSSSSSSSLTSSEHAQLEQASWSKEYCARVNSMMIMVNGPRPFKCKICRRMFNNRTNLRRHIKALHSDEVVEIESPPPECYDYGHIDRVGVARVQTEQPLDASRPPLKKKRKSTDPPITGPYRCEICPRSFKMPAHLAVHRKTHRQIEYDQSELMRAMEQRREVGAPADGERTRKKTNIEPSDIIQLSDDDEDDAGVSKTVNGTIGCNDDLDDGFDEEEGSLRETGSVEPDLRPDPSSLAIVEIGAIDNDGPVVERSKELEEDDVVVVRDAAGPAPVSKKKPTTQPPPAATPARIPPGPLSSKLRYSAAQAQAAGANSNPAPLITPRPIQELQRKQSPSPATIPAKSAPAAAAAAAVSPYRCHLCRETFAREELLREHQLKEHQPNAPCAYRCGWCKKGFRYRQNYTLHLEKQTCRLINADPARGMQQQQHQQHQQLKST
uniref:C2H2-type domain-containing protein n=1 Tax=Anopheles farauti TaxID=69004 RepID=A0A182QZB0_9DIPT